DDRPSIVARCRREYRPDLPRAEMLHDADPSEIRDPRRFKPTKVDHVVHVPEGILVAPLNRDLDEDRLSREKYVHLSPVVHAVRSPARRARAWLISLADVPA